MGIPAKAAMLQAPVDGLGKAVGVTRGPMGRVLGRYPEEVSGGQITQGLAVPSQEF